MEKLPNGETFNITRDYLTSEELQTIIYAMKNEREYVNRINNLQTNAQYAGYTLHAKKPSSYNIFLLHLSQS